MTCQEFSNLNDSNDESWFKEGLKFSCTGCGKCCTGSPGFVFVTDDEIEKISTFLNLTVKEFSIRYLRKVNGKVCLTEMRKNYDCVFLENNQCKIYPVRPTQCQTFPFWPHILKTEKAWEETARDCEGIQPNAELVSYSTINQELQRYIDAYES